MSVRRRQNWQGQQRVDVPHLKSVESAISNDFDELISGLITGIDKSYVIRGFKINMPGSIGSSANGLQLLVEDTAFLHGSSDESGSFYTIPVGTPAEILSSTTNERVEGAFTPNTDNYVGIEFARDVDDSTIDQVYFWNPTTNVEITKTVPLAIILDYKIVISTSSFASNVMPITVVRTDSSNNVVSISDRRPLLNRLGTAGDAEPNPFYSYPWAEGRAENFYTSTSSTSDPFSGGDKQIKNLKELFDAFMTEFKALKGTPFWYSASAGSISRVRQDIANTAFTGKGSVSHAITMFNGQVAGMTTDVVITAQNADVTLTADTNDIDTLIANWNADVANADNQLTLAVGDGSQVPTANISIVSTPGQMNWNSDIFLSFIGGRLRYQISENEYGSDVTLLNNQVAYLQLVRGESIIPNLVFTNGGTVVTSVGSVNWTSDLQAGDFIKNASEGDEKYYEIASVDSLFQVTLTTPFQELSSGPSGFDAQYAFGVYETNPIPSNERHVQVANRENVPFGEDYFWLFFRQDDTGSLPKVYARILGGQELEQGESQGISDNTSKDILTYIGSASETDNSPDYLNAFGPSETEVTTFSFPPASSLTTGQSFTVNSASDLEQFYAWTNKDSGGGDPTPAGLTPIEVAILGSDTDVQVAGKFHAAIDALSAFNSIDNGDGTITVTNANPGATTDAANVDMGGSFSLIVDTQGAGEQNYYLTDGHNLTQSLKILDSNLGSLAVTVSDVEKVVNQNFNTRLIEGGDWSFDSATSPEAIFAEQNAGASQFGLSSGFRGQIFTTGLDPVILSSAALKLSTGFNAGTLRYVVKETSGGLPVGAPIAVTDPYDATALPSGNSHAAAFTELSFTTTPTLSASTQYALILELNLTAGNVNLAINTSFDAYAGGYTVADLSETDSWSVSTPHDLIFFTKGVETTGYSLSLSSSAFVQIPGLENNANEIIAQTITLPNEKSVAWVDVRRSPGPSVLTVNVDDIADVNLDSPDTLLIARKISDGVLIGDTFKLEDGQTGELYNSDLESINQNVNVKMIDGGTWSWDLVSEELTSSEDAYVQVTGLSNARNTISAQTLTLTDGDVAYVDINRKSGGAVILPVTVAQNSDVELSNDRIVVARRVGDEVIVGTSSFTLENRDYLTLDGAKAEIDRRLDQLKVQPAQPVSTRITISASDIIQLNGSKLSLEQRNLLLSFDGAQIDFNTGEVFEEDGVTPLLAGSNDFIPQVIPASEYFYYSVSLLPNSANADNTISGQILVIPATGSDASLAAAPKAPFPGTGIKLANIYVQQNVADTSIENIDFANITSLGVGGSGSGGAGDATSDETAYRDRLSLSPYSCANMNIASVDEDEQIDELNSTATFDIPTGNFKFTDSTAQALTSIQQIDIDFLEQGVDIGNVELFSIWNLDSIDAAATYEVSRNGGANYQAVTMGRIGNSDSFRGLHNFTEEPSNAFNQEYAVANADSTKDFTDTANQWISQKFTVADTTVYKDIFAYISKDDVDAVGRFCVEIVKDDAGAPSTDLNDSVWTSSAQSINDLALGNNVVQISSLVVVPAGDYHLIIKPDAEYVAEYTANVSHKISARIDSSAGPTPNLRTYDGSVWSAEAANETMVYRLEGRVLDVRVRITSSATAEDKFLSSYAVFYGKEDGVEFTQPTFNQLVSFDGTVDNLNSFPLTFLPDSRLLFVFARGTGQTFRYGDFTLDGQTVKFPENTFNVTGTVELEFFQIAAVDGVTSSVGDALLTANHLGSTDPSIDKSVAGYGIMMRSPDGTLYEVTIKDGGVGFDIYEVN